MKKPIPMYNVPHWCPESASRPLQTRKSRSRVNYSLDFLAIDTTRTAVSRAGVAFNGTKIRDLVPNRLFNELSRCETSECKHGNVARFIFTDTGIVRDIEAQ